MQEIKSLINRTCKKLLDVDVEVELSRPDEQFGDYATNVALKLAKELNKNPHEVAEQLVKAMKSDQIASLDVAGPGFINIRLTDEALWQLAATEPAKSMAGKTVVVEYSDPNPFKILHAGHLYTTVVGDAIANMLEVTGAKVYRVNYGGDVGLHVAKTMHVILRRLEGENPDKLSAVPEDKRSEWLATAYIEGENDYAQVESAKADIMTLNKRVYQLHADKDHDSPFAQIYWTCRKWSYDYFDAFYQRLGSHFDKFYPESETSQLGLETVKQHIGSVFKESDGAVVFNGEEYGLHTRVFINSEGLPTYEAKDIGLIMKKWQDFHFDRSIVITGNEQAQYMAVVLKAVEHFAPELALATTHLTHGIVKLTGGVKMSSRKGNILRAVDVLEAAQEANKAGTGHNNEQTVLAAVKYAFLRSRIGGDIVYDPAESVAVEGNSGPYLQYAHARARSIMGKSDIKMSAINDSLEPGERLLLRKISEYPEVLDGAVAELMPHYVCTYLYELAQVFNSFYEHNRVIGDKRENVRLQILLAYTTTLKKGLAMLGITAPEHL